MSEARFRSRPDASGDDGFSIDISVTLTRINSLRGSFSVNRNNLSRVVARSIFNL